MKFNSRRCNTDSSVPHDDYLPSLSSCRLPFIGTITLVIICAISGGVVHENVNDTQLLGTPQVGSAL